MIWPISLAILAYWSYKSNRTDRTDKNKEVEPPKEVQPPDIEVGKSYRRLFWLTVAAVIVTLIFLTGWQFWLWKNNELSRFLLPPHNDFGYFLFYVGTRFWAPYLVSWVIGLLGFLGFWALNKKRGGRLLYDEELYFLWAAVFLIGHPGWIVYLLLMAVTALIYGAYKTDRTDRSDGTNRVSFYHLWLPTAMAAILINQLLAWYWEPYLKLVL